MLKLLLLMFAVNASGNHWVKVKDSNRVHAYYETHYGNVIGSYYLPLKASHQNPPEPDRYTVQCAEGKPSEVATEEAAKAFVMACPAF
jgi:hypothetical protein